MSTTNVETTTVIAHVSRLASPELAHVVLAAVKCRPGTLTDVGGAVLFYAHDARDDRCQMLIAALQELMAMGAIELDATGRYQLRGTRGYQELSAQECRKLN